MKYTFCNTGNCFDFNPKEKITPFPEAAPITNLDFYYNWVKDAKDPSVYVMDNNGKVIYK